MKRFILIHYSEIGLKKSNISYFVDKLKKRLRFVLQEEFKINYSIKLTLGRLLVSLPEDFSVEDEKKYVEVLFRVFGIQNFKFVYEDVIDLDVLLENVWGNLPSYVLNPDLKPRTFRVAVKRSMTMPFKSTELEREIGARLLRRGIEMKVKMVDPEFTVDLEFFNDHSYFSFKKYEGPGGLSANSSGKFVSLISSGIDSPVASYMMMRRGARVIFVHFHAYPFSDKSEMENVKSLVNILSQYQFDTKLYLVPFGKFQKAISTNLDIPSKIRTVLYRRLMVRIAELVARNEHAKGLITGDSLGQVASQTPENMFAVHDASTIPMFYPLIGFDKDETVDLAEKIGTFKISKLPCTDTCAMFMPEHPELKANIYDVRDYEKLLPINEWVMGVLKESEIINIK
jgi:thiamine biosynthesis protein ThiI